MYSLYVDGCCHGILHLQRGAATGFSRSGAALLHCLSCSFTEPTSQV
jgi:hypothetical protein